MISRSRSPGSRTAATAPFFITIRRSVMRARNGSWVTKITAFVVFSQTGYDPLLVDTGVLYFVEEQDRGPADKDGIGNQERPGLSPREPGHPHGCIDLLAGKFVGERESSVRQAPQSAVPRAWMWRSRNRATSRSAMTRVFWVMSAMGFFRRDRGRAPRGVPPR